MTDTEISNKCFDIICTREVPEETNKGRKNSGTMEKLFIINLVYCVQLEAASN